ncbi:MAG: hypothetical protein HY557_08295 [Euryarchaeota archaeon]|nr:hypothetical protein [Euryarchaeota archaeon]
MSRRSRRKEKSGDVPEVDERDWEDWRQLREELGKRLRGRNATGETDEELSKSPRKARQRS